jgi:hypothetical protein
LPVLTLKVRLHNSAMGSSTLPNNVKTLKPGAIRTLTMWAPRPPVEKRVSAHSLKPS